MRCKGSIDLDAVLTGIIGFAISYMAWVFMSPSLKELNTAALNSNLPDVGVNALTKIQDSYDYAMVIIAAAWLLYILYSSIRREVENRVYQGRY